MQDTWFGACASVVMMAYLYFASCCVTWDSESLVKYSLSNRRLATDRQHGHRLCLLLACVYDHRASETTTTTRTLYNDSQLDYLLNYSSIYLELVLNLLCEFAIDTKKNSKPMLVVLKVAFIVIPKLSRRMSVVDAAVCDSFNNHIDQNLCYFESVDAWWRFSTWGPGSYSWAEER